MSEDIDDAHTTSTWQSELVTVESILETVEDLKAQGFLEEYRQWERESMLRHLEELSQPTVFGSAWRTIASFPFTIEVPPMVSRPLLARETPKMRSFIPEIWIEAQTRSLLGELYAWHKELIREAHKQLKRDHQRARRQHRTVARRRKRGLA